MTKNILALAAILTAASFGATSQEIQTVGPIEVDENGWITCRELLEGLPETERKALSDSVDIVARWSRCGRSCHERVLYRIPNESWIEIEKQIKNHAKILRLRTVEEYKTQRRAYLAKKQSKPIEEIDPDTVDIWLPDSSFAEWWAPDTDDIDLYIQSRGRVSGHPPEEFFLIVGKNNEGSRRIYVDYKSE